MVAISLYRGNLHRVPDAPRRWLMPTRTISLKDFKILLNRRSKALARLRSSTADATTIPTTSNSNPNPNPNLKQEEEDTKDNVFPSNDTQNPNLESPKVSNHEEGPSREGASEEEAKDQKESDGGEHSAKPVHGSDTSPASKPTVTENASNPVAADCNGQDEKPAAPSNPNTETSNKVDAPTDKEKRKREVEEKLQILNGKKHNLVQLLKQILNAEEELKRRNSMQGIAIRPSVPLQVDATNDSGSMTRHATPRMGSEGNHGGDMEGGEADDFSNHSMHSRHLLQMSSTSPSSDSPHRRPAYIQHNVVPHPSRASLAVAGSPSRFAPMGHQGHPANLPTVSVSGTNYIASSPSPAASGGTSGFRDGRLPSPWN
ncbi:hypothetical protein F0562_024961 [Nyssa sinensis]|uniref:Uncharacterized protein n=1 Tax=Nyssa sinensis TaxID=561372 RepID=A0A5J5BIF6_9ASTE|nr:hypothetical protein F0562_024961 [Nyssa sinensis]